MDLYCQRCGEPYDIFSLQDDMTLEERERFKCGEGCPCCYGKAMCKKNIKCSECADYNLDRCSCNLNLIKRPFRAQVASALSDILGDDLDGIASEMEDAELYFGSEFSE